MGPARWGGGGRQTGVNDQIRGHRGPKFTVLWSSLCGKGPRGFVAAVARSSETGRSTTKIVAVYLPGRRAQGLPPAYSEGVESAKSVYNQLQSQV